MRLEVLSSKAEVRAAVAQARREGRTVGFVPTMGALHDGHLSLVHEACGRCDHVLVSIFVNPTQFDEASDFDAYPRDLSADLELLSASSVEWVFAPSAAEMYGAAPQVIVDPGPLAERWEGACRPGHFAGVATVVAKLLNVAGADAAFFGEKDYQQLKVVERLARDLDFPTRIVGCPVVREPDGLALSSRNARLTEPDRRAATVLYRALSEAADCVIAGECDAQRLTKEMARTINAEPAAALEYAAVVDPETLEPLEGLVCPARALVAARFGGVRLIDTMELCPNGKVT